MAVHHKALKTPFEEKKIAPVNFFQLQHFEEQSQLITSLFSVSSYPVISVKTCRGHLNKYK